MFASHHWPRWGNERIQEVLRGQRDLYANMNNQVLHLANQGVTINQIHNVYEVPKSLQEKWYCRGYHGSPQHNARGVVQRYLGFWDCNPATLIPLSPADSAPLYVEMMGGSAKIIARGRAAARRGQLPARPGDREQAGAGRARQRRGQGSPGRHLRADRLPAGEPRAAQQLPRWRLRTAHRHPAGRDRRQLEQPRRDPRDVDRAVPELPRHPHGQPQGRGPALHHQPRRPPTMARTSSSSWRTRRSPTSRASRRRTQTSP